MSYVGYASFSYFWYGRIGVVNQQHSDLFNFIDYCEAFSGIINKTICLDFCHGTFLLLPGLTATCARIWGTSTGLRPIGSILLYLPTNVSSQYLRELASFLGLKQINNLANVKRILLDLIFTSISSGNVSNATDELLPVDIHNPAFLFCCTLPALNGQTQKLSRLHFRKCHTDSVLRWLQGVDYPVPASTPDPYWVSLL